MQLAKPMIALLSKEYHQRQAAVRPNVVQALLEGISCRSRSRRFRVNSSSSRQDVQRVAHRRGVSENHVVRYPQEARCFDALAELYRLLGERTLWSGCGDSGATAT